MRGIAALLLALTLVLAPAAAAQAEDDGPPELLALVRKGGPIGKDKDIISSFDWLDAGRHGHIAFLVSVPGHQELWEYRSSTEKPYGHLVQIASSDTLLSGLDFSDDGILTYRAASGCEVYRSVEGLPPTLMGKACTDPAKGDANYVASPGGGAYFRGSYYFKAYFGKSEYEKRNAFVSLTNGGAPQFFSEECPTETCRNVRVDPSGGVWGATLTDIYRLKGGKPEPYIHSVPAFVDFWGIAKDQIFVTFGDHVDTYGLGEKKRRRIRLAGGATRCCGVYDGNLVVVENDADPTFYGRRLVRADRTASGIDYTEIAKKGDPVSGSIKGSKLTGSNALLYSSPATWDGTAAFIGLLNTGREVLIVRRP